MAMHRFHEMNGRLCTCGKIHKFDTQVISGRGVVSQIADVVQHLGARKAFVLSDRNTYAAAGERVCACLEMAGVAFVSYILPQDKPEPDEKSVGAVIMHFDAACDCIVGVGSGVINDLGKILSAVSGRPYIIVATAPSMDGYAAGSSSMERSGMKVSLASRVPDVIIGDADILCNAPLKLIKAGLGDMLAKYISICEWRLAEVIVGEYYCPQIAQLIRSALKRCVDSAAGLLSRDETAVMAMFEGLVIGGIAMNYAGISRPASGVEHYMSHILDMRGAAFGTPVELHGLQCAIATLITARLYEKLRTITPDREKALRYVAGFDYGKWRSQLLELVGSGAENMIALEKKEGKYNKAAHPARLDRIIENWGAIRCIIQEEVPPADQIEALLDAIEAPKSLSQIGIDEGLLPSVFAAAKDIRDKYVLSRLCWDLGILEEII